MSTSLQTEKPSAQRGATTESSVLFSLASLSSMAAPQSARAAQPQKPIAKVESASEPLFGVPLPAPVLAPVVPAPVVIGATQPRSGERTRAWIAAACVIAVAILGGSYVAGRAVAGARTAPVVVSAPADAESGSTSTSDSDSTSESTSDSDSISTSDSTSTSTSDSLSTTPSTAPRPRPRAVPTPPAARVPPSPPSEPATLQELLERAAPTTTPVPARPSTPRTSTLPVTPSRDDVTQAMRGVTPAVSACGVTQHGTATVRVTVDHSGRVSSALVSGELAGTPAGSCVAQAVRGASLPAFSQSTFVISYPFRI